MGLDLHVTVPLAVTFICISVCLTTFSQVLLKIEAKRPHKDFLSQYLNVRVIVAYGLFFVVTLLNVVALSVIPLSYAPVWNSAIIVLVNVVCALFLHESFNKRKILGVVLIVVGISCFMLQLL